MSSESEDSWDRSLTSISSSDEDEDESSVDMESEITHVWCPTGSDLPMGCMWRPLKTTEHGILIQISCGQDGNPMRKDTTEGKETRLCVRKYDYSDAFYQRLVIAKAGTEIFYEMIGDSSFMVVANSKRLGVTAVLIENYTEPSLEAMKCVLASVPYDNDNGYRRLCKILEPAKGFGSTFLCIILFLLDKLFWNRW